METHNAELEALRAENANLRRQLGFKDEALARKNRELDALHYVWCSGGCSTGVDRWNASKLTEEIVKEAERNTIRLRSWWNNNQMRKQDGTL